MVDIEHEQVDCDELLDRLSEYIDGELSPALCAELEVHLAGCPDCQVLLDTVRKTIVLYRKGSAAKLPAEVEARLYHVLKLDD